MSSAGTVVIGPAETLPQLRARLDERPDTAAFSDAEIPEALQVIAEQRPSLVCLDRLFAATTRGMAFVKRLSADVSGDFEIRVVAHDDDYSRIVRPSRGSAGQAPSPDPLAPELDPSAAAPDTKPLDRTGTRAAPRYKIREGVEVQVDGNPVTLVNLSTTGAQIVSPTILRPNQIIRVTVAYAREVIRFSASIAWASMEMSKVPGKPQYRAGVEFNHGDFDAIQEFCERYHE
ncbi:MAG: PilZ domain-containing protein [Acidobacteria bacterium]|nr:PilZ domain-containing protein [Acidobacteriota bacterium]